MNKGALLGLALIAIGVLAFIFQSNQQPVFNFFSSSTVELNESKVVDGDKITTIDIHSSSPSVYLIPTDSDEITIELNGEVSSKLKNSFSLDVSTNRNKLKVKVNRKNETIRNFFGSMIINAKLEIYVPEKLYDSITIQTSSGAITIEDLAATNIELRASSGSIEVSGLHAEKELNLASSSGRIEAKNSQAKTVKSAASSGAVTLKNLLTEKINVATSSGKIDIIDSEGEITAAASSGRITIENEQLNGNINVSTSSGRVEVSFDELSSAIIDFKGSSGKGNVSVPGMTFEEKSNNQIYGKVGSGDYEIKVRTSSGGFDLN
ncbi:DUF4097 family beta strand repeat protein [Anaerobacillus sp. CMMVII]|uniref:DUF4097 domain-containing protein n=1 Tax=Anaerobacillus sp. CMMVII TaxID=2755588 RepID=UPI0021B73C67|nr:DUF4097 domain-containing protein [Anaerobacillus sp. CMMVII]MCT8138123.1 DUF4097 family beta strand repeat protein [Anaerobacillus sp. CMMVII]